jgi:CheY-like chemotaxis protein
MTTQPAPFEILLAEDNPADVVLVREALQMHEIHCALYTVRDGASAIAFIEAIDRDARKPRLDLLLLDMHMPRRGGEDILRTLRATERCAQTPVVVMTSSTSPSDEKAAERNAVLHYFRKPSELDEFMELGRIIKQVLTNKHWVSGHASGEVWLGGVE